MLVSLRDSRVQDSITQAIEELARKSGAKPAPAHNCVVVAFDADGQPDYLVTDELQTPDFALECARREAADGPGETYAVFQLVSTTVAAVLPPVTTPA